MTFTINPKAALATDVSCVNYEPRTSISALHFYRYIPTMNFLQFVYQMASQSNE